VDWRQAQLLDKRCRVGCQRSESIGVAAAGVVRSSMAALVELHHVEPLRQEWA